VRTPRRFRACGALVVVVVSQLVLVTIALPASAYHLLGCRGGDLHHPYDQDGWVRIPVTLRVPADHLAPTLKALDSWQNFAYSPFRFIGIAHPHEVVRRIDDDVRDARRDNWAAGL